MSFGAKGREKRPFARLRPTSPRRHPRSAAKRSSGVRPPGHRNRESAVLFMDGLSPTTVGLLVVILAASALMSGLSGFGFSAVGALCLILLPPKLGVPLLMTLSAANQLMSLRQLKGDMKPIKHWWPDGPAPYLLGGLVGVPIGLAILGALPTAKL